MMIVLDMSGMADRAKRKPFLLPPSTLGRLVRGEVEMRGFDVAFLKDAFSKSAAPAAAFLIPKLSFSALCAFHDKTSDDRDGAGK